ncbi:MAG: SRPBCC family protein [Thermoplasmata archaeon]
MAAKSLTIRQVYQVKAPVKAVFRALTEPAGLVTWFLAKAKLEPRRGGSYEFTWQGGYRHRGKVLDYVKNRRLSLTWPTRRLGDTRVTFTLRRAGAGTRIEIRHTGYQRTDAWLEMYGGTQSGWAYFFVNLKSVLEHGHDLRTPGDAS